MNINMENSFTDALSADPILENYPRTVPNASFSWVKPISFSNSEVIHISTEVLELLGLDSFDKEELEKIISGQSSFDGFQSFAMRYGGHQFGHWAGQLGDGRAINIGEINTENKKWALQLKGAGPTPYSRTADGFAVLRSSIREYLCSEAMFNLGVPTTRALSIVKSGEEVMRDVMYDGNPAYETGAIVCRVAQNFIRFGNFEILTAHKEHEELKKLCDYTITNFFKSIDSNSSDKYLSFFEKVCESTLSLIIEWERVGFVHGVMNTDNLSIMGETIDYGPYGWLEDFNPNWTPNTTDRTHKRYAFGKQASIGLWNLVRLANALYPVIKDKEALESVLTNSYQQKYLANHHQMMCQKMGISDSSPTELINGLKRCLQMTETDMTIFFRLLANISTVDTQDDMLIKIEKAFYQTPTTPQLQDWKNWFGLYSEQLIKDGFVDAERKSKMNLVNPKYVLRNYIAQLVIDDAEKGDYKLFNEINNLLKKPYAEQPEYEKWFAKRPEWARTKVGCSMLSCSS